MKRSRSQSQSAQPLELVQDDPAVFFLPLPDALDEFLAAQVVAGLAFPGEFLLDDILGGDPRVIHPGHPEGVVTLHAAVARMISCRVLFRAWPMWSIPVTLGGGMTMQKGLRSLVSWA